MATAIAALVPRGWQCRPSGVRAWTTSTPTARICGGTGRSLRPSREGGGVGSGPRAAPRNAPEGVSRLGLCATRKSCSWAGDRDGHGAGLGSMRRSSAASPACPASQRALLRRAAAKATSEGAVEQGPQQQQQEPAAKAAAVAAARSELKTCKHCKQQYREDDNHPQACRFHTAHYGGETKRKFEGVNTGGTMTTVGGGEITAYWHCCGRTDPFDVGCVASPHQSYDD